MEAQQVIDKILADAKQQADNIKTKADQEQAVIQNAFDKKMQSFQTQSEQLAKKAAQDEKAHILASTRMEMAKQLLAEKQIILNNVFTQARERLLKLSDQQYTDLMKKLMLKAVETGDEQVIVDNNEKRIDQNFIDQVNQQITAVENAKLIMSSEKQNIEAGFILKRGKIRNNVSLSVLIDQARKELEIDIAKEIFEDAD